MKTRTAKIASITGKVLLGLIILIVAFFIILTLSRKRDDGDTPSLFGYSYVSVLSNSMNAGKDGDFRKGDLLVVKTLTDDQTKNLKVGDIITFRDFVNGQRALTTHRINSIFYKTDKNGKKTVSGYITKGDNNPVVDDTERAPEDIVAIYNGTKIGGGGNVMDFLKSQTGFLLVLVLPLALFFIWRIYKLVRAVADYKKVPQLEGAAASSDAHMDSIAQLLADANVDPAVIAAAMAKAKDGGTDPGPAAAATDETDGTDELADIAISAKEDN